MRCVCMPEGVSFSKLSLPCPPEEGKPGRGHSTGKGRGRNHSSLCGFPHHRGAGQPFILVFCPRMPPSSPQPFFSPLPTRSAPLHQEEGRSVPHPCFQPPSLGLQLGFKLIPLEWAGNDRLCQGPCCPLPQAPSCRPRVLLHRTLTGGTFVAEPGVGGPSSLGSDRPLGSMSFPAREQRGVRPGAWQAAGRGRKPV